MGPAVIVVAIMISCFATTSETVASDLDELPVVSGVVEVDFAENGTGVVGSYAATAAEGATIVWSVSGDDRDDFGIDSGTGVLSFVGSPDFEDPTDEDGDNVYVVTVEASDGGETGSLAVTVTVSDMNEPPTLSGVGEIHYTENGVGVVGTYTAVDPEGATIVWGLSGDDRDVFSISSSGELGFVEAARIRGIGGRLKSLVLLRLRAFVGSAGG